MNMEHDAKSEPALDRRSLLKGIGAVAAIGAVAGSVREAGAVGDPVDEISAASADCLTKANACIGHAIGLYKLGDPSMGSCTEAVVEMTVVCQAMFSLASMGADSLKPLAAVCLPLCEACERECRKHADAHKQCKECADACLACIAAIKKLLG